MPRGSMLGPLRAWCLVMLAMVGQCREFDDDSVHNVTCSSADSHQSLYFMHYNQSGTVRISIYGQASRDNISSIRCSLNVIGCDSCKFGLDILQMLPVDTACVGQGNNSKYEKGCIPGCSYVMIFEPPYWDVTTRYYPSHVSNASLGKIPSGVAYKKPPVYGESAYTTLSSKVSLLYCARDRSEDHHVVFSYRVIEKREVSYGSPSAPYNSGTIMSPNFPHGYARYGEKYKYILHNGDERGTVYIIFRDWDLNYQTRVIFYDAEEGEPEEDSGPPLSIHYGHYFRPAVRSRGPTLLLEFESDIDSFSAGSRSVNQGFLASFYFLAENVTMQLPVTDCGGHMRYTTGGQEEYTPSHWTGGLIHDCIWVIHKSSAFSQLQLRFTNLTLEDPGVTVSVRAGMTSSDPLVRRLNGSSVRAINQTSLRTPVFGDLHFATSEDGYYIHIYGVLSVRDVVKFTFVSFNTPINGTQSVQCWVGNEFFCTGTGKNATEGMCIDRHLICDEHAHCVDGTDEDNFCEYLTRRPPSTKLKYNPVCRDYEFTCAGGTRCIPTHAVCDDWLDCPDGSDEYHCGKHSQHGGDGSLCQNNSVMCGGRCVLLSAICLQDDCLHISSRYGCVDFFKNLSHEVPVVEIEWSLILPICFAIFCVIIIVGVIILRIRKQPKYYDNRRSLTRRPRRLPIVQRVVRCHSPCSVTSSFSGGSGTGLLASRSGVSGHSNCCCHTPTSYDNSIGSPSLEMTSGSASLLSTPSPFTTGQQYKYFSFQNCTDVQTSIT